MENWKTEKWESSRIQREEEEDHVGLLKKPCSFSSGKATDEEVLFLRQ